ncbi:conserved membrane hypothetical protein [Gammaproteobacteria bacterium]
MAMGASFLQTLLLARELGPSDFGILAGVQAFCVVFATFLTFRTSEPLTRYLVAYRKTDPSLVKLLLGTAILVDMVTQGTAVFLIVLFSPWAEKYLPGGIKTLELYPFVGIALLRTLFDHTWFSVARDQAKYRVIAMLNAFFPIIRTFFIAILTFSNHLTLYNVAVLMMFLGILQMGVTGFFLQRAITLGYGLPIRTIFSKELLYSQNKLTPFWSFMKATFLWSIFGTLAKEGDILVLSVLRPAEEVGAYRLAKSLAGTIQQVADLLAQVIYQDFSTWIVEKNRSRLQENFRLLSRRWVPAVATATLLGALLANPVILGLFGHAYALSAKIFSILLLGVGVATMLFWVRPLALAFEMHWYNLQVVLWGNLLFAILDWTGIQWLGVTGAAWAFAFFTVSGPLALLVPILGCIKKM